MGEKIKQNVPLLLQISSKTPVKSIHENHYFLIAVLISPINGLILVFSNQSKS